MTEVTTPKSSLMENLKRIVEFWPLIVFLSVILTFLWKPIKEAVNIASLDAVAGIELRLKNVEARSISIEQGMKLHSIAIGEAAKKLTPQEAQYYSTQVFRGTLDDKELQMKLYGVAENNSR